MALTIRQLARKGMEQNIMTVARQIQRELIIHCPDCGREMGLHIGQQRMPVWRCKYDEAWTSWDDVRRMLRKGGIKIKL